MAITSQHQRSAQPYDPPANEDDSSHRNLLVRARKLRPAFRPASPTMTESQWESMLSRSPTLSRQKSIRSSTWPHAGGVGAISQQPLRRPSRQDVWLGFLRTGPKEGSKRKVQTKDGPGRGGVRPATRASTPRLDRAAGSWGRRPGQRHPTRKDWPSSRHRPVFLRHCQPVASRLRPSLPDPLRASREFVSRVPPVSGRRTRHRGRGRAWWDARRTATAPRGARRGRCTSLLPSQQSQTFSLSRTAQLLVWFSWASSLPHLRKNPLGSRPRWGYLCRVNSGFGEHLVTTVILC